MKGNNVISSDLNLKLRSTVGAQFPDCAKAVRQRRTIRTQSCASPICYVTIRSVPDKGDSDVYSGRISQRNLIASKSSYGYCSSASVHAETRL